MDKSSKKIFNKDIVALNNALDEMDFTDVGVCVCIYIYIYIYIYI